MPPDKRKPPPTRQSFWALRCLGLEGSHVDSIFYSTGGSGFSHALDCPVVDHPPGVVIRDWLVEGCDGLSLVIEFCRRNGIEVFWSLRMNDFHDNWHPWMLTPFKREHPELLLFQPEDIGRPRQGLVEPHMNATALDYGREEIRDRACAIIRHVCERYDIDGIELDFLRQPIYFRPTLDGRPVEPEHVTIMSGFMARVRELTEKAGKDRGKPILVAVTVPNVPALALGIGLDIETWLRDDRIDMVIASLEHTPFSGSVAAMAAMAHRHNAPVYARLPGALGSALEGMDRWAGAAVNARRGGVDGLQTFNKVDPHWEGWRILGEPSGMAGIDKTFAADCGSCRTWEHVVELEGRLPWEVPPGEVRSHTLKVGEDVARLATSGRGAELALMITVEALTYRDEIEFLLNGAPVKTEVYSATEGVSPAACGIFVFQARPDAESIRHGDNTIEVRLGKLHGSARRAPAITELFLTVKYRP